jgi:hypothetical protein
VTDLPESPLEMAVDAMSAAHYLLAHATEKYRATDEQLAQAWEEASKALANLLVVAYGPEDEKEEDE